MYGVATASFTCLPPCGRCSPSRTPTQTRTWPLLRGFPGLIRVIIPPWPIFAVIAYGPHPGAGPRGHGDQACGPVWLEDVPEPMRATTTGTMSPAHLLNGTEARLPGLDRAFLAPFAQDRFFPPKWLDICPALRSWKTGVYGGRDGVSSKASGGRVVCASPDQADGSASAADR